MKPRRNRVGPKSGGPPDDAPWTWVTREMVLSPTWGALSISARRVVDALMTEHMNHAGRENGNLAVTYLQLEALGVTKADIRKALVELQACGFIRMTHQGLRVAGGGEPSRFALTWLPTLTGSPIAALATNDWLDVRIRLTRKGLVTVRSVRRWLRDEVRREVPARRKVVPSQDIEGTPQVRGEERLQVRGETLGNIVALTPQMRGVAVRK